VEEIQIKLSVQVAMRLAQLEARVEVANKIMSEVMDAYKKVCDAEQQRMDVLMTSICDTNGQTLPANYEYSFDPGQMMITFRGNNPSKLAIEVNGHE